MARASSVKLVIDVGTERDVVASWNWTRTHTDGYTVKWYYATGAGVSFLGSSETVSTKYSKFTPPENAYKVWFYVKPIAKKHKVNKKNVSYWTADWSTKKEYVFGIIDPPRTPPAPTVEIDNYKLTASLDNLDVHAKSIQFQIVKNDTSIYNTGTSSIITNHAAYSCNVSAGYMYKVRCRSYKNGEYSDWSEYSSALGTKPSAPSSISKIEAKSETSVYLEWPAVANATTYDIEYATKKEYFDGSNSTTTQSGIEFTHYEVTGLESGSEYFFRVRAVNDKGESDWSGIASIVIGKKPAPPTTWSSTTTVITGEPLILYWAHNSEDGSAETYAELELTIDGVVETYTIQKSTDEIEKYKTSSYSIDTSQYTEGSKIQWRVRTSGVTNQYGDFSIQRTIDIYSPPTLTMDIKDINAALIETLTSFPFYVSALAEPATQAPIGYYLAISANEAYETIDDIGNTKTVNVGEVVYSKYFDITDPLLVEFTPGNIDLENNISYTVTCTVSMNSGLTAESSHVFNVAWTDIQYDPDAEVLYDDETVTASIRPYCEDELGNVITDVTLSLYRREFDGTFIELAKNLENSNIFVTDPHPSLDYARYRVVAISKTTGAVSYYDIPGYPVNEKAVIIQWDEEWSNFYNPDSEDELEKQPWSGSLLRLPYNIDVSDNYSSDVELVNYIGRKHPVSYYGTNLETSSDWGVEIDKEDKETLYGLRRLATWTGDVYVREPSGSGYWANISVSFSQTHRELTIPVSISITRVDGGV